MEAMVSALLSVEFAPWLQAESPENEKKHHQRGKPPDPAGENDHVDVAPL